MRGRLLLALILVAAAVVPAAANGRYPSSKTIAFRRGSGKDMIVGLTFGAVITHDDGEHWYWTCEDNIGYGGTEDPTYELSADDGTIYAATYREGVRVSRDGGCSFETAPLHAIGQAGRLDKVWVSGIDLGSDGTLWAVTAENGAQNAVYKSTDKAVSFSIAGLLTPSGWWKSVKVAPSDSQRIYVTGYQIAPTQENFVEKSIDGGQSWMSMPVTDLMISTGDKLLLEGVDPTDPDIVYVVSGGSNGGTNRDRLYRSANGGGTWTDVLDTDRPITGFAILGSGDVLAEGPALDDMQHTMPGCLWRSTDHGVTFGDCETGPASVYEPGDHPHCLASRDDGVTVACGGNWTPDHYTVGRSDNAQTWSGMLRFNEIAGPLECPHGTKQRDDCVALIWPMLVEYYDITGPYDAGPPDGGHGDDGGGGTGCCDASSDGAGVVVIALVAGALLVWRGRRRKKKCCT